MYYYLFIFLDDPSHIHIRIDIALTYLFYILLQQAAEVEEVSYESQLPSSEPKNEE